MKLFCGWIVINLTLCWIKLHLWKHSECREECISTSITWVSILPTFMIHIAMDTSHPSWTNLKYSDGSRKLIWRTLPSHDWYERIPSPSILDPGYKISTFHAAMKTFTSAWRKKHPRKCRWKWQFPNLSMDINCKLRLPHQTKTLRSA